MSASNGRKGPKGRKTAATTPAHASAATVARGVEDAAGDLAVSLDAGCSVELAKLALIVLMDCRRRLARLTERVEGGGPVTPLPRQGGPPRRDGASG
jgi:hypothetical protein